MRPFFGLWKIGHSQSHPGQVVEYKTINFFSLRWLIIKLIYHRTGSFSCWMSSQILCLILSSVFAPVPTVLKNVPKGRNIFTKWHSCATASHSVTTVCGLYGKWDHTAAKWLLNNQTGQLCASLMFDLNELYFQAADSSLRRMSMFCTSLKYFSVNNTTLGNMWC